MCTRAEAYARALKDIGGVSSRIGNASLGGDLCYSSGMKTWFPLFLMTVLASGCTTVSYQLVTELPGETLSVHRTVARYQGVEEQPCRFMTSECPDACDHGGTVAVFAVEAYTDYARPGQYGDPKQTEFRVRVAHSDGTPDAALAVALRRVLAELEPGDRVKLGWAHVYVTDPASGSKWPERVITDLEK